MRWSNCARYSGEPLVNPKKQTRRLRARAPDVVARRPNAVVFSHPFPISMR
jgi:hypothetical protein